jgi:hypothetical protein
MRYSRLDHRMNTPLRNIQASAFSRIELCATIAALFLLAAVALPVLAQPFSRSQRLQCLNNLRQIGQAFQVWGNDHGDDFPFFVSPSQGGVQGTPEASRAYYQLAALSNQLSSPRILACPSDSVILARLEIEHNHVGIGECRRNFDGKSQFVTDWPDTGWATRSFLEPGNGPG